MSYVLCLMSYVMCHVSCLMSYVSCVMCYSDGRSSSLVSLIDQLFITRYALTDKQFKLTHINLNLLYYYDGFEEAD